MYKRQALRRALELDSNHQQSLLTLAGVLRRRSELDAAVSKVSETTLYINAHDRYNLVIIWEERVYASTVTFSMDGTAYTAEYKYLLEVPRPGSIKPGICTPLNAVTNPCQLAG